MKGLHMLTYILLVIGGLNWGLYVFGWDVERLLSLPEGIAKIIYALVGVSTIIEVLTHRSACKHCETQKPMGTM